MTPCKDKVKETRAKPSFGTLRIVIYVPAKVRITVPPKEEHIIVDPLRDKYVTRT
jgi:hypothetical protein